MLYGSSDRVVDGERQSAGLVGRLSRLDIEIVEGVGHMPQFAEPQRVAAFVKRMAERAFAA
jgi:pimeloyl-ACP methyl ester carboxylesterase